MHVKQTEESSATGNQQLSTPGFAQLELSVIYFQTS